ncbi:hypothetical protein PLICRDRAFT_52862 [Plicaturopsis crispa FD-325 SS-3]|nr:hypothetical protein PLICRDRAFT_52862 [Plicaturopsis crispa FD-325 SS-3]
MSRSSQSPSSGADSYGTQVLTDWLIEHGAYSLRRLRTVRDKGWDNQELNNFYKEKKERADTSGPSDDRYWVTVGEYVMRAIDQSSNLVPACGSFHFLDLGFCPGGYAKHILGKNTLAHGAGVSLPVEEGGNGSALPSFLQGRLDQHFIDLTFYDLSFGDAVTHNLPPLPFPPASYDLVVLDAHHRRPQWDRPSPFSPHGQTFPWDIDRLLISQLIIGLSCIKHGGTMLVKMHRPELAKVAKVIWMLDMLAEDLTVFKPKPHAPSSGFSLIAKGIRDDERVQQYIKGLRLVWWELTYGGDNGCGRYLMDSDFDFVVPLEILKATYGKRLAGLCQNVWATQAKALNDRSRKLRNRW